MTLHSALLSSLVGGTFRAMVVTVPRLYVVLRPTSVDTAVPAMLVVLYRVRRLSLLPVRRRCMPYVVILCRRLFSLTVRASVAAPLATLAFPARAFPGARVYYVTGGVSGRVT